MEQVKVTLISRLLDLVLKKHPNAFNQIDSLDGLRVIAVLFVLVSHLSNAGMDIIPPLSFSGVGKVGVWFFFYFKLIFTYVTISKQKRWVAHFC